MKAERQRQIIELVMRDGRVTTTDLFERFGVSEMTVRRDLRELQREGLLRRVYGGAVNNLGRSYEPPYQLRSTRNLEAKKAIGRKAAEMVFDGDSIALDVGTTTVEIVRALEDRHNLTIITPSLPIANEVVSRFSLDSQVRLIVTGGIVRSGELSMIGNIAEQMYRDLHVDKAFVGIGGLSLEDGLTEYNLEDALIKRSLLKSAHQIIVVADGSKLGRTTFASIGPLSCVDTIVTDSSAPEDVLEALREMRIRVIVA